MPEIASASPCDRYTGCDPTEEVSVIGAIYGFGILIAIWLVKFIVEIAFEVSPNWLQTIATIAMVITSTTGIAYLAYVFYSTDSYIALTMLVVFFGYILIDSFF